MRLALCTLLLLAACSTPQPPVVEGPALQWQPLTVSFTGPQSSEDGHPNPFLNYRLNVVFEHPASRTTIAVPGYFAADGDAAQTGAAAGATWRATLLPTQPGEWTFRASFREGAGVA